MSSLASEKTIATPEQKIAAEVQREFAPPRSRFHIWILPWLAALAAVAVSFAPVSGIYGPRLWAEWLSRPIHDAIIALTVVLLLAPGLGALIRRFGGKTRAFDRLESSFRRRFAVGFDALISTMIVSQLFKSLLAWERPSGSPTGAVSGHTMTMFVCAWCVATFYPRLAIPFYALAVAVGWSRVETETHFGYQVILGAILGNLVGYLATQHSHGFLFRRIWIWWRTRKKLATDEHR